MFKLVVLFSAVCALTAGKPGALLATPLAAPFVTSFGSPLAYSSSFYSPTFTKNVLQPALLYQSPTFIAGAHSIKKRSAIAPFATSFAAPLTYTSTIYSPATTITKQASSVLHPSPLYQAPAFFSGAHFIKKRSAIAPLISSPAIIAPTAFSSHIVVPTKTIYSAAAPIIAQGAFSAPLTYAHN